MADRAQGMAEPVGVGVGEDEAHGGLPARVGVEPALAIAPEDDPAGEVDLEPPGGRALVEVEIGSDGLLRLIGSAMVSVLPHVTDTFR